MRTAETISTNKKMTIIHLNIRNIHKHFEELIVFLEIYQNKFDVIVCSETWNVAEAKFYQIDGYIILYNGKVNQNDGIIVFICNSMLISHTVCCDSTGLASGRSNRQRESGQEGIK